MLILALVLAKKNNKVTIYEKSEIIGGSWAYQKINNNFTISSSTYLINQDLKVYNFLKNIGIYLKKMDPQPNFYFKGKSYNYYSVKRVILGLIDKKYNPSFFDDYNKHSNFLKETYLFFVNLFQLFIALNFKNVHFPINGSISLLDDLLKKINQNKNIKIINNHKIKEISFNQSIILNKSIHLDQLFIPKGCSISNFIISNKKNKLSIKKKYYHTFLIRIKSFSKLDLSYIWFYKDKYFNRISKSKTNLVNNYFIEDIIIQLNFFENKNFVGESILFSHLFKLNEFKNLSMNNIEWFKSIIIEKEETVFPKNFFSIFNDKIKYIHTPHLARGCREIMHIV